MSYGKMVFLHSRSRPQWSFRMLMNVCRDDIFWTTEHFITTGRAYVMKIWLLYYLNCWFLGNQTWSDDTSSEARLSYEKKWITAYRVKITAKGQNLMFVQMISSKPSNILFSNLVLWFFIMSQSVMQKDWFAVIKVKVTARTHMI